MVKTFWTKTLFSVVVSGGLLLSAIIYVSADTTVGTDITTTGKVGVGHIVPDMLLDIQNTSSVGAASFSGSGLNNLVSGGTYTGANNATYTIIIDGTGTPDTFKWKKDDGSYLYSAIAITGVAQTLVNGVTITFGSTTGHTLNDQWTIGTTVVNPFSIKNVAGTRTFTIANDGSIGIGTTTPVSYLHNQYSNFFGSRLLDITADTIYGTGHNIAGLALHAGTGFEANFGTLGHGLFIDAVGSSTPADNYISFRTTSSASSYSPTTRLLIGYDGNIGIGAASPGAKLEVDGGVRLNTVTAKPTCDSSQRGTIWVAQGADGVKDSAEICLKDAANAYAWRVIY